MRSPDQIDYAIYRVGLSGPCHERWVRAWLAHLVEAQRLKVKR